MDAVVESEREGLAYRRVEFVSPDLKISQRKRKKSLQ